MTKIDVYRCIYDSCDINGDDSVEFEEFLIVYKRIELKSTKISNSILKNLWVHFCYYVGVLNTPKYIDYSLSISFSRYTLLCIDLGILSLSSILSFLSIEEHEITIELKLRGKKFHSQLDNYIERIRSIKRRRSKWKESKLKDIQTIGFFLEKRVSKEIIWDKGYRGLTWLVKMTVFDWMLRYEELEDRYDFAVTSQSVQLIE